MLVRNVEQARSAMHRIDWSIAEQALMQAQDLIGLLCELELKHAVGRAVVSPLKAIRRGPWEPTNYTTLKSAPFDASVELSVPAPRA
jgi:hypothetical protein